MKKNPETRAEKAGAKAPLRASEFTNRKGTAPARPEVRTAKKVQSYKSIPKAKRIDPRYGERKAPGGARQNVKTRGSRQRSKSRK